VGAIGFRGRTLNSLRFRVPPNGNFGVVLRTINELAYPPTAVPAEQINFAVLELVSNSLRAHREKAVADPVLVEISGADSQLLIRIIDRGGGFDLSRLPYRFDEDVSHIDLMSENFVAYRASYDNSRFGMGLVATRRVFPGFRLYFVDQAMQPCRWPSKFIVGTVVELPIPLEPEPPAEAATEVADVEVAS